MSRLTSASQHRVDTGKKQALQLQQRIQVSEDATHCRPLRHLKNLRELRIVNGWVCDLVGYLPRLEKLVWTDVAKGAPKAVQLRTTLYSRDLELPNPSSRWSSSDGVQGVSNLRYLELRGRLTIDFDDMCVRAMLERVEHVEVHHHYHVDRILDVICQLRHIKRLAFLHTKLPVVPNASERARSLACADVLEVLVFNPGILWPTPPYAPLPLWFHDRLPNLRVLASPLQESLVDLAPLCPNLTHLHLPFSTKCAFPEASRQSLRQLCVVSLSVDYDCAWLRQERGPGRALPSLQRIFHPTTDCLSAPVCSERRVRVGKWVHVHEFARERVLVLSSKGMPMLCRHDEDELFSRTFRCC